MGLDLTVMASHFRERRGEMLPTATLRFDRDTSLFDQLARLARRLPDGLMVGWYGDDGLVYTDVDRAGNPLTFISPSEVANLGPLGEENEWNHAVLAFMRALPEVSRIVLYWC